MYGLPRRILFFVFVFNFMGSGYYRARLFRSEITDRKTLPCLGERNFIRKKKGHLVSVGFMLSDFTFESTYPILFYSREIHSAQSTKFSPACRLQIIFARFRANWECAIRHKENYATSGAESKSKKGKKKRNNSATTFAPCSPKVSATKPLQG